VYAQTGTSQTYQPKVNCSISDESKVSTIYTYIESNQSKKAVVLSKEFASAETLCPEAIEAKAWALFRHGQWERALAFVDEALEVFGPLDNLVTVHGYMSFEMAELGAYERMVDGNAVLSMKHLNDETIDPPKFRNDNYIAALQDFESITDQSSGKINETYLVGIIHQRLGNANESNKYLTKVENNRAYSNEVKFMKVVNYIDIQNYTKAEELLKELETMEPDLQQLHEQYIELYKRMGKRDLVLLHSKKRDFSLWVPTFLDLEYSESNYQDLHFLIVTADAGKGFEAKAIQRSMHALVKADRNRAVKLLVTVLNAAQYDEHASIAPCVKELTSIGTYAVPNLVKLLHQECPSTLPATWAATILSNNNDPRGWQALEQCLPHLDEIPFSVVPPPVPECMLRLNQEKALPILLRRLKDENLKHRYHYLYPLKKVPQNKISEAAKGILTSVELQELLSDIDALD